MCSCFPIIAVPAAPVGCRWGHGPGALALCGPEQGLRVPLQVCGLAVAIPPLWGFCHLMSSDYC